MSTFMIGFCPEHISGNHPLIFKFVTKQVIYDMNNDI